MAQYQLNQPCIYVDANGTEWPAKIDGPKHKRLSKDAVKRINANQIQIDETKIVVESGVSVIHPDRPNAAPITRDYVNLRVNFASEFGDDRWADVTGVTLEKDRLSNYRTAYWKPLPEAETPKAKPSK